MSTLLKMQKFHPLCSRCIGMYPLQNRWTVLRYLQCYENFSECCTHLILPETALFSPTPTIAKEPKEIDKALDEKARERYASLTDDEIMELLVNKKWYYAIGKGIIDLYTAISHKLAERITEISKGYKLTLTDLDGQINEAESSLSDMLGELTGNDYDMKAFAELIELLGGSNDVK